MKEILPSDTQERIVRHRSWFEVGTLVTHRVRPRFTGVVEAIWTDHKLAQEFAQVLWMDGSRDIVPTDQLELKQHYDYKEIWRPEPTPRKEYLIRRRVPKDEIDIVGIRAMLETQGYTDDEIKKYIKELSKADVYETVEGWKIFELKDKRYVLKGKLLREEPLTTRNEEYGLR